MKLTHITTGQAGLHAETHEELHAALASLQTAGYVVTDVEDDADEPIHAGIIHYAGHPVAQLRAIKDVLGLPYPGKVA